MNELSIKENVNIENMIYVIRGKQVMLDSDLAKLYQCKNGTKEINQAVKNNIEKFPERYRFQLSNNEYNMNRSKILTSSQNAKHSSFLPYVFTEQGVYMLATILKTEVATQISIKIMDAFVSMRKYVSNSIINQHYYNDMIIKHDAEIKILQEYFSQFKEKNNHIFYEGQIYDAYSLMLDILKIQKKTLL